MTVSCEKCRYSSPLGLSSTMGLMLECRHSPPAPSFPVVRGDWWCGKGAPKPHQVVATPGSQDAVHSAGPVDPFAFG